MLSQRLLQATKAGRSSGNDDEVSAFNLTVLPNILLEGLKLIPLKKGSLMVHTHRRILIVGQAVCGAVWSSRRSSFLQLFQDK